jgi:hypothetical protein
MVPRMSRYGAYVPGPVSCWPVLDHLVKSWVALVSAAIICGQLVRRASTQYRWQDRKVDAHDADWRSL